MSLENSLKDCISSELEKGIIEKVLSEKLEECIASAVKDMFSWSGEVRKVIEEKIKSVMVPYLESYDYSRYIAKLDAVLVEVLKNSALDNKKILENFKELMIPEERKSIKVSELYEAYTKYVAENVDTDDLKINYDDYPTYQAVDITLDVEYDDRGWGSFEHATLVLECKQDENMNFAIKISRWKESREKGWDISYSTSSDIKSLRRLSGFELFLIKLTQANVTLEIDTDSEIDEVTPEKEPEASYS